MLSIFITGTLVSNATSKRVCIKLVTQQEPLGHIFYFTSSNSRNELNDFKDALCRARDSTEKEKAMEKRENLVSHKPAPSTPSNNSSSSIQLTPSYAPPVTTSVDSKSNVLADTTKDTQQRTKGGINFDDVVDDFFSIKEDNRVAAKTNVQPHMTKASTNITPEPVSSGGGIDITVRDPQKIADSSKSYVTYEVVAKVQFGSHFRFTNSKLD